MIARLRQVALAGLVLLGLLLTPAVGGAREYLQLFVNQPYLELHTGPGRGYPVFHVVPRDAEVEEIVSTAAIAVVDAQEMELSGSRFGVALAAK